MKRVAALVLLFASLADAGQEENKPVRNDVTFFLTSDVHFGLKPETEDQNKATLDDLNALPGQRFPEKAGGALIPKPRGVLITGDLTEMGNRKDAEEQWKQFEACYGLNGEGYCKFPVYEGVGNHDGNTDRPPRLGVKARNAKRLGVKKVSENGQHYSWDWDDLHFICCNLYVGSKASPEQAKRGTWTDPQKSLEFVQEDLAQNVGNSGRPVILYHHYGFDGYSNGWYAQEERDACYDAIKGYNILAIFYGHTHGTGYLKWNGIDCYNVPAAQPKPRFLAVRVTPSEMVVTERKDGGWGQTWKKAIAPLLKPAAAGKEK